MFTLGFEFWFLLLLVIPVTFGMTLCLTFAVRYFALKMNFVDSASSAPHRKKQIKPVALLGGVGFTLVCLFSGGILWLFRKGFFDQLLGGSQLSDYLGQNLEPFRLFWIYIAVLVLLVGGILDDIFQFKSKIMILPMAISLIITVTLGGIKIESLAYPFNNLIPEFPWLPSLLAFVWLGFCLLATKYLDGHDGLVTSVGILALLTVAFTANLSFISQPFVALLGLIWVAGLLGFLPFNLPNAKMYLGESGSVIIGYIIGVLAVISGAKIATAATVLGWFVYDLIFVMLWRVKAGQNPLEGDRRHWHLRMVDLGWGKWRVLLFFVLITGLSGFFGIFLSTYLKAWFLILQGLIFFGFLFYSLRFRKGSERDG